MKKDSFVSIQYRKLQVIATDTYKIIITSNCHRNFRCYRAKNPIKGHPIFSEQKINDPELWP